VDSPTILLDANGDVVVWNDAEAELVGVDRQEVVDPDGMIGEELYDGGRRTILRREGPGAPAGRP